jgi:alpha-L-rhamnosidase
MDVTVTLGIWSESADTGILATKWLMELLSLHGRTDVGLDLVFKTSYPGWGYMASMNSTTVRTL